MEKFIITDHRLTSSRHSGLDKVLYNEALFAVHSPFGGAQEADRTSGRKRRATDFSSQTKAEFPEWPLDHDLADGLRRLIGTHREKFPTENNKRSENEEAKSAAGRIPSGYFFQGCDQLIFHNKDDTTERRSFQNREFIIPPRSVGILGSLNSNSTSDVLQSACTLYGSEGPFDVVIIDPPWMNKSVKRQRCYMTSEAEDCLSQISIPDLLHPDGLLLVWYTHNNSHYARLKRKTNEWNLQVAATWTWLKVTTTGLPVCPLGRNFKKPYEHLMLATRNESLRKSLQSSDGTVLVSVPSAVHSHKPNLEEVLKQFGFNCEGRRCLELFARTMKPYWVSFGNEVIKLQCVEMFENLPR